MQFSPDSAQSRALLQSGVGSDHLTSALDPNLETYIILFLLNLFSDNLTFQALPTFHVFKIHLQNSVRENQGRESICSTEGPRESCEITPTTGIKDRSQARCTKPQKMISGSHTLTISSQCHCPEAPGSVRAFLVL